MTVIDAAIRLFVEGCETEEEAHEAAKVLYDAGYHYTAPGWEGRLIVDLVNRGGAA